MEGLSLECMAADEARACSDFNVQAPIVTEFASTEHVKWVTWQLVKRKGEVAGMRSCCDSRVEEVVFEHDCVQVPLDPTSLHFQMFEFHHIWCVSDVSNVGDVQPQK